LASYSEINVMLKAFQMNKWVKENIIMGQDRAVGLIFEADSNKQGANRAVFKSIPLPLVA
jgi:hypothetical protein